MTKKLEIGLPFFSGFYDSIHSSALDREEEEIIEMYEGKSYEDFSFTVDYLSYCKNYVHEVNSILDLNLEFVEMTSPREYNFSTDRIFCTISKKDLKKISSALDTEIMRDLVKKTFTSRDGFISFYSNNIDEWKEKPLKDWDYNELGILLYAYVKVKKIEDIDFMCYQYCSTYGQYLKYKKLWDEEAEKREKELHQEELNKLEKWKKAVAGW